MSATGVTSCRTMSGSTRLSALMSRSPLLTVAKSRNTALTVMARIIRGCLVSVLMVAVGGRRGGPDLGDGRLRRPACGRAPDRAHRRQQCDRHGTAARTEARRDRLL